jgi:TnpA family transposase
MISMAQRAALFDLPMDEALLLRHYTLSDEDIDFIRKGEAHHALKGALRIGRQGEIRDRTTEGQHFRIAGLNLLTAIINHWNSKQIGIAVAKRQRDGLDCSPGLLSHISPLGWAHIILTGEYRWRKVSPQTA